MSIHVLLFTPISTIILLSCLKGWMLTSIFTLLHTIFAWRSTSGSYWPIHSLWEQIYFSSQVNTIQEHFSDSQKKTHLSIGFGGRTKNIYPWTRYALPILNIDWRQIDGQLATIHYGRLNASYGGRKTGQVNHIQKQQNDIFNTIRKCTLFCYCWIYTNGVYDFTLCCLAPTGEMERTPVWRSPIRLNLFVLRLFDCATVCDNVWDSSICSWMECIRSAHLVWNKGLHHIPS